jgi:hypothetical protein
MRRIPAAIFGSALLLGAPISVHAQAYLGEANALSANFAYTYAPSGKIILSQGDDDAIDDEIPNVPIIVHTWTLGAQYNTPVEGLAIDAQLPLTGVKLGDGSFTHTPTPGEYDDGDMHYTLTDFRGGLRYQFKQIEEYLGLSVGVGGSVPVRDYPTNGLTAPGHHLKALILSASVARTLDPIIPDLFFEVSYDYSLREKVDDTANTEKFNRNMSDVRTVLGYFLPGGLTIDAGVDMRFSHGGLKLSRLIFEPADVQAAHDRLLDEDFVLVGGDIGYSINDKVAITAGARFFVWGVSTRNQNLFGLNLDYSF